jgi:hypothetical protein
VPAPNIPTTEILGAIGSNLVTSLLMEIGALRRAGMGEDQVRQRIKSDWDNGQGMVGSFRAQAREAFNSAQQSFYGAGQTDTVAPGQDAATQLFTWHAVGVRTCVGCVGRMGQTRTFAEWQAIGVPGAGATPCRFNCRCTLLPVEKAYDLYGLQGGRRTPGTLESTAREPIRRREREIRAAQEFIDPPRTEAAVQNQIGNFRDPDAPTVSPNVRPD